jgi:peptide/nickel transport system permease protein
VLRIVGSRILQMIPVVIGVTLLSFIVVNVLPGNVLYSILGDNYTKAAAAATSKQLGLDHPLIVRYLDWLGGMFHGNLGTSLLTHQSIGTTLWHSAPPSVELVIGAQVIAIFLSVVLAFASVASPTPWVDRIVTGLSLFGNSIPSFVTGLLMLTFFSVRLHLFSAFGWVDPSTGGWAANIGAIFVPSLVLAISVFPGYLRIFRREMYEQLENEEYVVLARMKGISHTRVVLRHVARNSALGIITLIGLSTGLLIGGAVIVENIFNIPGIGSQLFSAINGRDAPLVQGCVVVIAVAIVLLNLVADLTYAAFDPRVRSD